MYGPTYENHYWRLKTDEKMYNELKSPDIVTVIKVTDWNSLSML
jgi:hypothetical protein